MLRVIPVVFMFSSWPSPRYGWLANIGNKMPDRLLACSNKALTLNVDFDEKHYKIVWTKRNTPFL